MVTRIDRLARSIADLQSIVRQLNDCGAKLQATQQPIDTSTAAGTAFFQSWACSQSLRRTFVDARWKE